MSTKRIGISLYPGLWNASEEIATALERAAKFGTTDVFTSLLIPEANPDAMIGDCEKMCAKAEALGMRVTADIAPVSFKRLGVTATNLARFKEMGLYGVRTDAGFSVEETAAIANNAHGLKLVLNASAIKAETLGALKNAGVDLHRVGGCHNFYPRIESGLSLDYMISQSRMLREFGVEVAAFVASQKNKRAVMYEGLPTVETQRELSPGRAARELFATGVVDLVYVGDPLTPEEELEDLARAAVQDYLELRVGVSGEPSEVEREVVFGRTHEQPWSVFAYTIRSRAARQTEIGPKVQPRNTVARPKGTVTVDNVNYARFAGEVQIALRDLPADPRVNVVGRVVEEDLPLLDLLGPGARFGFTPVS